MADKLDIQIKGLDEIEKRLQQLPEKLRRKSIGRALKDGTQLIVDEARIKAQKYDASPVTHPKAGHLSDAIASKVNIFSDKAIARVGVDYTKVKHGHLVEFGTHPHKIGKRKHPGAKKQPFMRPAFDAKGDDSLDSIITDLAKAVEKEV